jgi:hypothetical protein
MWLFPSEQSVLYFLAGANVIVYALLVLGIIRSRSNRVPQNPSMEYALGMLERSLRTSFPDMPEGYTWREVINRLKYSRKDLNWPEIDDALKAYEESRYGHITNDKANAWPIIRLTLSLPRGEKFAGTAEVASSE